MYGARRSPRTSSTPDDNDSLASWEAENATIRAASLGVGVLAAAGGFLDGFTYIGHGRVFANSMSGNLILFGAHSLTGSWDLAGRHLPPLLAFVAAVWSARALQLHSKRRGAGVPYGSVLLLEIAVLLILTLVPSQTPDVVFTTSIAFAATMQIATFREVNGHTYSSTFTTGNLRTLSEATFIWLFEGRSPDSGRIVRDFSVIVGAFLLGAVAGGLATKNFGNRALWCDIGLLLLVAFAIRSRTARPTAARPVASS